MDFPNQQARIWDNLSPFRSASWNDDILQFTLDFHEKKVNANTED